MPSTMHLILSEVEGLILSEVEGLILSEVEGRLIVMQAMRRE
jgi:hypothetical protein